MSVVPPGFTKPLEICPICGEPLENFFIDDDLNVAYIENFEIQPVFIVPEGIFMLQPDEDEPLVDHIVWHHQH